MDNGGDILQLCRLCLVKDDVNIPIFDGQGDIRQIFLKISSCLPVKVSREDQLPKKICDGCSYKLDMLYEFWNTTANAEKQLLSWLGEAGMNSKMNDDTISAVAQQIKPVETFVKQETIDPSDIHTEENDDDKTYMFQQKYSVEEAGPSATTTATANEEEPPPKRARRTAAVKAQIAMDPESDYDDDSGEPITKVEDESEESEGEDQEPAFVDVPSTSADDQPGPSGVGKDGVEAPIANAATIKQKKNEKSKTKSRSRRKNCNPKKVVTSHPPPNKLDEPVPCDFCDDTYQNHVDLAVHSIEHRTDGKYSCHICGTFKHTKRYNIEMHVRAHEGTTRFKCEICSKAFTVSTSAIEHKYFHSGEKPFQCEICGKHFMFSRQLVSHRRTSHYEILTGTPLVKFDCTICKKHYESAFGLRRHMLTIHNDVDMSVICEICGKRISSKEKLKFHIRTHTGYKPYPCENGCGKSFSKKHQMKEHLRVHTGEKPYVCKHCGRGFSQRTPMVLHERTHTGERPKICRFCGNGFISKTALDAHMRNCNS